MRHIMAVAVLGASLALSASAALAADTFDFGDRHPAQNGTIQAQSPDQLTPVAPVDPTTPPARIPMKIQVGNDGQN